MDTAAAPRLGRLRLSLASERPLSLAQQFALAGAAVLFVGMLVIGFWVTRQIEDSVVSNTAASSALYVDSLVAPSLQGLARSDTVSAQEEGELDRLFSETPLGRRIVAFKVWKEGGRIVFSRDKSLIGKTFPVTPNLKRAWQGIVSAEFDTLDDEENASEREAGVPLLEMYSPVREAQTGRIIAVAEFYETAEPLRADLFWAKLKSWVVVAAVTISTFGFLSGIVLRGSRTIDRQQRLAEQRIRELSRLLAQNEELRSRVQRASRRTTEINEQYLRRIGADLHDGPAQLLALASLRLDAVKPLLPARPQTAEGRSDIGIVQEALTEALAEIRLISAGLTLPELDNLSTTKLLRSAASAHERRTGTTVAVTIESAPENLEHAAKICIYRFVQEALSNAFRHAGGLGQQLTCRFDGRTLDVEVADSGPGFDPAHRAPSPAGLGLAGLRERVESLGGSLAIDTAPGRGTRLTLRLNVGT